MLNAQRRKIDRQERVARLRLSGVTDQRDIAAQLGVNQSTISRDFAELDAVFRACAAEDTLVARGLDLARLDALIVALWSNAVQGDLLTIDRVERLLGRRAKLLGLDAPTVVNVQSVVNEVATAYGLTPAESVALFSGVSGHLATTNGAAKR